MKNYVVRFSPRSQAGVLKTIRDFSNDIQIDHVEDDSVGITIELEDQEADALYDRLKRKISRSRPVVKV